MSLSISVAGLVLEVDLHVSRGWPGSYMEPPEAPEVDILGMTCQGQDAMFLLDSTLSEEILDTIYATVDAELDSAEEARASYFDELRDRMKEESMCRSC
jgi:hypothetical protein